MTPEKQIEDMQNTLIQISKQPIMIEGLEHWSDVIAEELYAAGYRKATDVARERFEEIEQHLKSKIEESEQVLYEFDVADTLWYAEKGRLLALNKMSQFIAELKKKWEVEE